MPLHSDAVGGELHISFLTNAGSPDGALTGKVNQFCWDTTNDQLYVNTDGAQAWSVVAAPQVAPTDGNFIVGDGSKFVAESLATARASLGFPAPILNKAVPGIIGGTTPAAGTFTNLISNANYVLEGYPTGRNVLRIGFIWVDPGATPGTNINVTEGTGAAEGFNAPTVTDATNLAKSGTQGSFSLDASGALLTMDITETVIANGGAFIATHDINNSSTTEMYTIYPCVDSGNLIFAIRKRGSVANVDWTTVMDAGDRIQFYYIYFTSS